MKEELINEVMRQMLPYLDNGQERELQKTLQTALQKYEVFEKAETVSAEKCENKQLVGAFVSSKRVEGCSKKSLRYYEKTIHTMSSGIGKEICHITTDDLRAYLTEYQTKNHSSRVTIDNIRRILSSFFAWLEDEDYIIKSPVRRIHKVKTASTVKETYTDESLELMRDNCGEQRDLAIIDMLASTGMRIGEMVLLNREDIDFTERECIVFGKGDKERVAYFDARTKIHLQNYLQRITYNIFRKLNCRRCPPVKK